MGIFVSNTVDLAAAMAVATGVAFTEADLIFGKPRAATSAEITQYGKNTAVSVNSSPSSTKSVGYTTIFYDRLQLQPLERFNLRNTILGSGLTVAQWLPIVKSYIGVGLIAADLVEHSSTVSGDKVSVLIEAVPTSLGWLGSATLLFGTLPDITTAFNTDKLNGF